MAARSKRIENDYSDEGLARSFVDKNRNRIRYVSSGGWHVWTGQRWIRAENGQVDQYARQHCYDAAAAVQDTSLERGIKSARTINAVQKLARSDSALAISASVFDNHPWLLNTPDGVLDLRTGKTAAHAPGLLLTQMTSVGLGGECPTWLRFVDRITGGDGGYSEFLCRIAGYALTGSTRDHALFFAFGAGANGKTTFVNTLAEILADFHTTAPMETFSAAIGERQTNDLARLAGARLVTSTETEPNRKWAEARIKLLTGGDEITVRGLYQEFFTMRPTYKILVAGNNRPGLTGVDEAIRRRMYMLPFGQTIPASERDPDLPDKLKAEAPGILAWMVAGCLDWQARGLRPPPVVVAATEYYLADEDNLSQWLAERTYTADNAFCGSTALYMSYLEFCRQRGEGSDPMKTFSQRLQSRGFVRRKTNKGIELRGLRLVET